MGSSDSEEVGEIEFSGGTYQVQVPCGEAEYWPFVQFGADGRVKDSFCSCDEAGEGRECVHLEAAVRQIYNGWPEPLHLRFAGSLWNVLCSLFGQRQGYKAAVLQGKYHLATVTHKEIFSVEAKSERATLHLEAIIDKRVRETEENSLKFSGLSYDELSLWREGRPSRALRYELSFWSDLAKWLMLCQESGAPYTIRFGYGPSGLPNHLSAEFEEVRVSFYLSAANLPALIPALTTVQSDLAVHALQTKGIESIEYDRASSELHIKGDRTPFKPRNIEGGIAVGEWLFVPGDGFYSREEGSLLALPLIARELVGKALEEHTKTISDHLLGERIYTDPVRPRYQIWFDADWNLHVAPYLFNSRDLQQGASAFFGSWAYLDDDGFYPLKKVRFPEGHLSVPPGEVSAFVHRNRLWLNSQEGFHTHLTTIEAQLSYKMGSDGALHFDSEITLPEGTGENRDFGDWIYISGQGFYAKAGSRIGGPLRAGLTVGPDELPLFLKLHSEELELVKGFFGERCPIASSSLELVVSGKKAIKTIPGYKLYPEYQDSDVRFFGEYVYVEGTGFVEIPKTLLLPERFRVPLVIKGKELDLFLAYELKLLGPHITKIDKKLQRATSLQLVVDSAETDRLITLELSYASSFGRVAASEIWHALSRRERYVFTSAGLIDLKETRFQWLAQFDPARLDRTNNRLKFTPLEYMRLDAVEQLEGACPKLRAPAPADYSGLKSDLRSYQKIGVEWLWFLYSCHISGLLCDDMGLGKTHQAMALLAAVTNQFATLPQEEQPQYLVVCPTSVLYHWREKIAQFLPGLRVYTFHGAQRSLEKLSDYDVVITSYGTLRSEREALSKIHFEIAILDEIQVAKNARSQTHRALASIPARMCLGLTGTPIENELRELKALFDLVLPTYMPSDAQFRDTFVNPIEKENNQAQKELLRRMIRPFVLRRKKEEVLTELPEKVEEKSHCELSPEQRKLYNELLERSRESVLSDLEDESKRVNYLHIFAILTALKRICDHPAVYHKRPQDYRSHQSGKWDLFVELLSQAQESNQKVVVFSQYLDMLDIFEHYCREKSIGFATIRGSTADRPKQLERFEKDPKCQVFIGSLQAAGLGIDLTAASIVIHYDRWWTQAREDQATDRVHRLGQTRGVQVFKLLTVNSLEERIDTLIESKGRLMEEIIGSDEKGQLKAFSREEIIELLRPNKGY